MDCREAKNLLDPYVDRELDAAIARHVDEHLGDCPACAEARERLLALRNGARDLRENMPFTLAVRIRSDARAELADGRLTRAVRRWRSAAGAASLIAAVSIAWAGLAGRGASFPAGGSTLADELVAGHVRSLMAAHLLDVASSDRHTVKPWFLGKLDFAPDVRDFRDAGFPLVGGRVDYVGGRAVAAVVYQRQKHVINAFTWPAGDVAAEDRGAAVSLTTSSERQGYQVLSWRSGQVQWSLVSDASESTLRELQALIQSDTSATPVARSAFTPASAPSSPR
jgi:anti-sigma factor RsiW